ncbi:phosphoribosylformylglycinamidine synthase subunit PurS [Candidatus Acetothermia bacterium]|jgi:phosphoribosylformylglycinamidine synthase|nr:phosphoribosylformylglycinamidine synthase subunit PurS [Candidatus Acetothermia bacterium]MCI2432007.1 phosphoribosylformylglycinamidine synthase subunit PurS [Candidatus Acetothermia bacterium]MCI2436804.1 phosphoribosylformylglycinamidine synthase subunit PurS [Candidatus Acetothermia bacterium]
MKEFTVRVLIEPKPELLDPQGQAVERAIKDLGLAHISQTRVGKLVKFKLKAVSLPQARERVSEIAHKLLANPVIERYSVEVEEL